MPSRFQKIGSSDRSLSLVHSLWGSLPPLLATQTQWSTLGSPFSHGALATSPIHVHGSHQHCRQRTSKSGLQPKTLRGLLDLLFYPLERCCHSTPVGILSSAYLECSAPPARSTPTLYFLSHLRSSICHPKLGPGVTCSSFFLLFFSCPLSSRPAVYHSCICLLFLFLIP